jgi:hypothetical protein
MKAYSLVVLFLMAFLSAVAQTKKVDPDTVTNAQNLILINKGVNWGVSLGFNSVFSKLHDARISPLDNQLKISNFSRVGFVISTGLSVPLFSNPLDENNQLDKKTSYFQNTKDKGILYYVPRKFYLVATVNVITFNSAGDGSLFNKRIDGGLGLGYRVNDDVQIAVTGEMISYRQPRNFLYDYNNKTLTLPGQATPLTTINLDDNDYFMDRYMPSVSLKVIYLFRPSAARASGN